MRRRWWRASGTRTPRTWSRSSPTRTWGTSGRPVRPSASIAAARPSPPRRPVRACRSRRWPPPPEPATAPYGPCWFAFAVIAPRLEPLAAGPVRPLGPVLFQALQTAQCARTAWLLARDLRTSDLGEGLDQDAITDLALRAVAIEELRPRANGGQGSRARPRETARSAALAALRDRAEAAGSTGVAGYWRGLRAWYSGADPFDPSGDPALMRGALRDYLDRAAPDLDDPRRHSAETLTALAGLVWGGDPDGLGPALGQVARALTTEDYLDYLADDGRPLEVPSPLLMRHLADLVPQRRAVERMSGAAERRPDESAIDSLLGQLETEGAALRLPVHELGLMRYLHLKAAERLRALRAALRLAAQIEVEVLNPLRTPGCNRCSGSRCATGGPGARAGSPLN